MAAAQRGDLRAWEWIARRYQELVFRSAYLATRDSGVAEDVTIDVLARAYRSLGSLAEGEELRPWLLRLTDTVARTRTRELSRRRDARTPETTPSPRMPASPMRLGPGAPRPTADEHAALVEAFDGLVDDDRSTLAARYAFWLDRDAAAIRLGVKPEAVDERLATATSQLRRRVGEAMAATRDIDPRAPLAPATVGRMSSLSNDQLGALALAAVLSELPWTPDVARLTCDRLAREAVAYPATSAMVASSDRRGAPGGGAADATPAAARQRGQGMIRTASLFAGVTLVGVSLVISGGPAAVRGWDLPGEVRSQIGAFLGEPASSSTASVDREQPPAATTATSLPAVAVDDPAPEPAAVPLTELVVEPFELDVSVVGVRRLDRGALKAVVRLDWSSGERDDVSKVRLERSSDGVDWTAGEWMEAGEQVLAVIRPGTWYEFRVRTDATGDEAVSAATQVQLTARGPQSDRLIRSAGDWQVRRGPEGGKRLVATGAGALLRTEFDGGNVALVGRDHVVRDPVHMRIDGGPWDSDPAAGQRLGRWVLFSQKLDDGPHALEVRAPSDGLGIDAVLILRSRQA